ncbi:TadE family type IV pilus minor pilin [Microbacterium sp. BWT-B31]|uniref:TadE family type IV pilus minor pilin n=1 Tax=Microbacterium sp. BWT-B31 TaxID=3232072 RepID=UPI0035279C13
MIGRALRRGSGGGRCLRSDDRGSVVAEFAIALPAVVLVLVLGAGALAQGGRQVRLEDAAADAARLVARGEDPARAVSLVLGAVPGAEVTVQARGDLVCVVAAAPGLPSLFRSVPVTSCALAGGR